MEGHSFAFADPDSTSGDLIPLIRLPKAGFSMESGAYFSRVAFSDGHEQTIIAVRRPQMN